LVRTQAFDTLGVHSFDALDAPMLIDSDAAQAAVLRSDVPASMLGGTAHAGVSGLAVLGGGRSRPVSMKRPLVRPADFEGLTWRDVPSTGRDAAVRAVAGRLDRVLHPWFMLPIGLKSGSIGVLESSLDALFFDLVPQTPTAYVTDGVRLWPNMSALIANPHRLARLSATQRAWLRQAAMEAQAYSVANAKSDRAAVADLCATGVRFVEAPAGTAAALRRAFSSAYSKLDRDAETRRYIERIQQLRSALPPEQPLRVPPACSVHHPAPVGAGPAVASSVPDGVYRTRLSAGDLRRAHITGLDVARYAGTETLTIARGRWRLDQEGSFGRSRASGTYSGTPLRTVWTVLKENGAPARPLDQSRYSLSYGNGVLRVIARPSDLESALYSSHPWERIG
jgi:TRAP-type C4-dicarboxylate transport system substrate-binding protein